MEDEKNAAPEVSPLVDYLIREERAHGRDSREIFKASDLRDSLQRKSSESMALKSKDENRKETVKGKAKVRYEANDTFSVSEVRAFDGRFSGDAPYTPRQEVWNWGDFPPPEPDNRLTGEEMSELQATALLLFRRCMHARA